MSEKKRIKPDATDISERRKIIKSFCDEMKFTGLLATDVTNHEHQIRKVYRQMLHEKRVIDECRRRFEKMFKEPGGNFILYPLD